MYCALEMRRRVVHPFPLNYRATGWLGLAGDLQYQKIDIN